MRATDDYEINVRRAIHQAKISGYALQECLDHFTFLWISTLSVKEIADMVEDINKDGKAI